MVVSLQISANTSIIGVVIHSLGICDISTQAWCATLITLMFRICRLFVGQAYHHAYKPGRESLTRNSEPLNGDCNYKLRLNVWESPVTWPN